MFFCKEKKKKGKKKKKRCGGVNSYINYIPDSAQAHFFTRELTRSFHTVILLFRLQIYVQADAQASDLIGQKLVPWPRSLKFIFEHVHFALHGLKEGGELCKGRVHW